MDTDKFFMRLYGILNDTDMFNIASLVVGVDHEHQLLVELINGEKYEIQVKETDMVI